MADARELVLAAPGQPPDLRQGAIQFIGTATVLLHYAGFTILTDPNFLHRHQQIHLGYGLTARRLTDPAIELDDLPPVDLVVLSHWHEDHFDPVVVARLDKALPIVTTPQAAAALAYLGFGATHALERWQTQTVVKGDARLRITATPGRHGPPLVAKLLPAVMGSILEFQPTAGEALLRMYITGDTLVFDRIEEIPHRYPDIDLALLHLGGTKALGILLTMDGKQGLRMLKLIAPKTAIPIHYNDYTTFKSPLSDFQREVAAAGLEDRVVYLSHGETYAFEVGQGRLAGESGRTS